MGHYMPILGGVCVQVGSYLLPLGKRTLIMGILNVTPDSFSDGGRYDSLDQALKHAEKMLLEGADMIDIGGESTRPGFQPVSTEEELERVIPIIEAIAARIDLPISVDTYKAAVAKEAVRAGAHIINDVWGAKGDSAMADVMAALHVPVILMHNRPAISYRDLMSDICADLEESIALVRQAGLPSEKVILDPGIGFAKTVDENMEVMRQLEQIVALGFPVLLGTSRKSLIGHTLQLPVEERLEGTLATVGFGVQKGCQIVRVHDVKSTVRFCRMMDALKGDSNNNG
jgi:dihydropteroate synthase